MKPTSVIIILCLVTAFLFFEGWQVLNRVWFPVTITSEHARLMGQESVVKTPHAGTVTAVHVAEGDTVPRGAVIAVIRPFDPDQTSGDLVVVKAIRTGIVSDIAVQEDEFVQASQEVAIIQELDESTMYVLASFLMSPQSLKQMNSQQEAYVSADFLNDGQPVRARISAVSPVYNADKQTVNTRVDFLQTIHVAAPPFSGLPVTVTFQMKNPSSVRSMLEQAMKQTLPQSKADSSLP